MDISLIVNVCSKAWTLPILAAMGSGTPGRQASLLTATGAGRSAFGPSIAHLIDLRLVHRRGGHGHPLRPEFELTDSGHPVAAFAAQVMDQVGPPDRALLRRSWTLPIVSALSTEDAYGEVRRVLSPITDRALSLSLQNLERAKWVERQVDVQARPPKPIYQTVGVGLGIAETWLRHSEAA